MKKDALLTIIAEWLEEWEVPPLVPRNQPVIEPADIKRILAVVGPRRAGKTYYMYQLIQSLMQKGRYSKEQILFLDFEDYRLGELTGNAMDEIFTAFHQVAGQYPLFLSGISSLPGYYSDPGLSSHGGPRQHPGCL